MLELKRFYDLGDVKLGPLKVRTDYGRMLIYHYDVNYIKDKHLRQLLSGLNLVLTEDYISAPWGMKKYCISKRPIEEALIEMITDTLNRGNQELKKKYEAIDASVMNLKLVISDE